MNTGFVKLLRTPAANELLTDHPNAFLLLTVIALRAWYSPTPNLRGLSFGQALIGDCKACGLTRKEYRTAQQHLAAWKLASFVGTPRGTVATLADSRVFSVVDERFLQKDGQQKGQLFSEEETPNGAIERASEGPPEGHLGATKKKERRKERQKEEASPVVLPFASDAFRTAWSLFAQHRREIRRPLTPTQTILCLEMLQGLGETRAIQTITHTVRQGYIGLLEPDPAKARNSRRELAPEFDKF